LDDYQNAINNKDIKLITQLNEKYYFDTKKDILCDLYEDGSLNYENLKNILFILLEDPTIFKITSTFLGSIIKHEDIKSLQLILNNYIYKNDLIKVLLYKYKYQQLLSNSELKKYCSKEIKDINLNETIPDFDVTPLTFACKNNNENIVRWLIENGADVNKENKDGNTSLIEACYYGNDNIIKLLIENGADVNKENKYNNTPLIKACEKGYENIVRLLIENGADVNKENKHGDTPLIKHVIMEMIIL